MTNVGIVAHGPLRNDGLFDPSLGRDNCLERFRLLRKRLQSMGIECRTSDRFAPEEIDILLFHDIHQEIGEVLRCIRANPRVRLLYVPNEPEIIAPLHNDAALPAFPFDAIMTWNDRIAGHFPNIFKCNIGQPVIDPDSIPHVPFDERRFICSIFANKHSYGPNSLYEERLKAVDFFSRTEEGMDLFGIGWEHSGRGSVRASYKGVCEQKRMVLQQYKFSIAYENIQGMPGLITEKIFDCFAAGTVPVYLGAPNIQEYIPETCFIDVRGFSDYDALYRYLSGMGADGYQGYLDAARQFLSSPAYHEFTSEAYAHVVGGRVRALQEEDRPGRSVLGFRWALMRLVLSHSKIVLGNFKKCRRLLFALVWGR